MNSEGKISRHVFFWSPVLLVVLILFGMTIFSGRALYWGLPITQFVPWWQQTMANLAEGGLPLWNPNLGMGAPLLANYQLGFFYPPNWLFLAAGWLGGVEGIAWIQAVIVALHLLWAAAGMRKLSQSLGLSSFGQSIAALAFAFSGYLVARAWFLSITCVVSWLPWVLWAGYRLAVEIHRVVIGGLSWRRDFEFRRPIYLALVLALQLLAGHAQITWYGGILLTAWTVFWAWQGPAVADRDSEQAAGAGRLATGKTLVAAFILLAGASLFAAFLAAVQLAPTAEYLLQSQRASAVDYEAAMTYSFWPWRFLGFLAPDLFGNPAYGNYWGYANFWEDAVYIGLIPFLLAVRLLVKPGYQNRTFRYLTRFLFTVIVVSFLLAAGQNLPLFPWLYRNLPTFDMFNAPTRWSILAVFSLSLLAGIGASKWSRPQYRALYWTRLGTAAGFAITLGALAGWLALRQSADAVRLQTMAFAIALMGIWALGGGLLTLTASPKNAEANPVLPNQRVTYWHLAAVVWIAMDLVVAGFGLNPAGNRKLYADDPGLYPQVSKGRVYMPLSVEQDVKFEQYFQFSSFHAVDDWELLRETYLPNINILNGLTPALNNFDPMVPDRYSNWMAVLESGSIESQAALLNLSGVSTVVNKDPDSANGTSLQYITPRAYLQAYHCQRYFQEADDLLAAMLENPGWLENSLFVEGIGSDRISNCDFDQEPQMELLNNTSAEKVIQVSAENSFWLQIAESWYPGWQATIDGMPAEILLTDYVFQSVAVPAGEHEVRFIYSPMSFKVGLATSFLSLALLGIFSISRFLNQKN